jgi:NADPH-dependent curcumin reductase CurA
MVQNKGLIYKSPPNGWPVAGKDLAVEARTIDLDRDCPEGGLIVKNNWVSFDPYQRGRMRASGGSYVGAFTIGEPITNRGIATVAVSRSEKWKVGDVVIVEGTGTEEYTVLSRERAEGPGVRRLENPLGLDPKVYIAALGMPGLTAWSSLYEIGNPKAGETLFVSAASGAVGQIVGQLGKKEGMTVIGSVGNDAKLDYIINELGFDGGFNYKNEKPIDALKRLCPKGIDIYYDNVGGEQLETAITLANVYGRLSKALALIPSMLTSQSRVRHDLAVQPQTGGGVPDPQPDADGGQEAQDAGLSRQRPEHGAQVRGGAQREAVAVDQGRQLQGQDGRDQRH